MEDSLRVTQVRTESGPKGGNYLDQINKDQLQRHFVKRLQKLGINKLHREFPWLQAGDERREFYQHFIEVWPYRDNRCPCLLKLRVPWCLPDFPTSPPVY
jgi:hypothetical protein